MSRTHASFAILLVALTGCFARVTAGPRHHPHPGPYAARPGPQAGPPGRPMDGEVPPLAGWKKLGERTVHGVMDHDTMPVGADDGVFRRVRFVVEGSALEMYNIVITFGDGSSFSPPTRLVFDRQSMSREIDLPGDRRVIRRIDLRYGNLPGGGRARVEAWAQ